MACSNVRLCTEILPTGLQCKGIALKCQPWCREHATPKRRARNASTKQLIATIPNMDSFQMAFTLWNTTFELQTKVLPPLHAYAIFEAAMERLAQLTEEARLAEERARFTLAQFEFTDNPSENNRLHVVPVE